MKQYNKLFAILFAVLGVQTLSAQTDVTSKYLKNADLSSLEGWAYGFYTDWKTDGDVPVIEFYHTWSWDAGAAIGNSKDFSFTQEVTLPAGEYRLAVNAFYREGNGNGTNTKAYIFAGEQQQYIVGMTSAGVGSYSGSNDLYKAANAFSKGDFSNAFDFTVTEEAQLEIGFRGYIDTYCSWCILGPMKLYQYSMDDFNTELMAARTKLQNVTGLNTAMQTKVNTLLNETQNVVQTKAAILEATSKVNQLYDEVMIIQPAIAEANAAIVSSESMLTNSTADDKSAFSTAISTAKTNLDNAEDVATITSLLAALNEAKNAYCLVAAPAEGYPFDMTHLVINPKFDEGTTGWSFNTGAPNHGIATNQGGAITGNYFENWQWESYTGEIYQELTGLPKGKYKLTAAAFRDQLIEGAADGDAVYVFANDEETLVNSATPVFYSVEVSTTTGSLRLGVKSKVVKYRWMGIDNVSLQLIEALDLSEFIAAYNTALEAAKTARDNAEYANITGVEKTALLNAIANTPEEEQESLADATIALQSATATFIAAKVDYDLLVVEEEVAKNLGMSDATVADIINNKTGLTALYDLREYEYVYVMDNFNYPVALSNTWNSNGTNTKAADLKGEHWSDNKEYTYKNQYDGWDPNDLQGYPANEWEIDFDQEVTLPAGEYVFKVAGRKSVDATLELVVTMGETVLGTVNDFPSTNEALGINKAGATSFDANDPAGFAKEGKGYGWQWRYVKFTLDAEATVKVAVHAETDKIYNWVSFGDYTLQMTEGTYLEANKDGLDAALAPAEALVNTLPMGDAENTALQTAIDMPVTTGAEMLAKVEALNEAVAAANEWVAAYNEAKAPLVAALERFEADYNDAENGALSHMNKARWATVINMAQAAAEAKDVTNNYDGFEAAANALIAALDAATVSIGEYADLKSAIENANTIISGGNIGNGPFQRPQSAVDALGTTNDEQAVYDAAEKDGEEVTSLTEALRNGCEIELNAPAEGARYNMIITYGGWEHDGKAVTYLANNRSDQGLYDIKYHAYTNVNYAQAFTFTAVEGQLNCYTLSMTDVDGNERYVCNGVVYGGNTSQLRTTTNAEEALAVKVIATTTDGIYNLYNTEASNYIGGQDAGFYTVDSHIDFNIVAAKKAEVALSISSAKWATLILPFNAELPEGVKAYSCGEADGENLTLVEAESFVANTPYLVSGEAGTYNFSDYGLATKDSYTDGLFTGTYVEYTTTPNSNTYVLQNGTEGVAFYRVGESAQPKVKPYRCYMTYEASAGAPVFRLGGTTGIDNAQADNVVVVYDLMGRKVSTMEKGGIYIVNGKKVVVK